MKRLASHFSRGLVIAAACALLGVTAVGCGDDDDGPSVGNDGGDKDGGTSGKGGTGGKGGSGGTSGKGGSGGTGGTSGKGGSGGTGGDPDIDSGVDEEDAGN